MSLKLAEQLMLLQEYIKIDKTDFNRAMDEAMKVMENTKAYIFTLRKIKRMEKTLKSLNKIDNVKEIAAVLDVYPQIKSLREAEVLINILKGMSNKEIAEKLNVSEKAIKFHKNNIFKKCGYKNTITLLADSSRLKEAQLVSGQNAKTHREKHDQ